jgi:hypothetical protein
MLPPGWRPTLRRAAAIATLFTLQLLAGHTQTAFISGVAVGVWTLTIDNCQLSIVNCLRRLLPLGVAVGVALLLAGIQLLPTLELTGLSARQGGLPVNEVLSFSWHPLLVSRSLLPTYGQSLFSEYVAFLPLTGLVLAIIGAWGWRQAPATRAALLLALLGLFLALGLFNPLYWLLARLPGFDLFRVPARWLVLYALGAALLAGVGLERLRRYPFTVPRFPFIVLLLLMLWSVAAAFFLRFLPTGPEAPFERPFPLTWLLWGVESVLLLGLLRRPRPDRSLETCQVLGKWRRWGLAGTAVLFLFLASRSLPYNHLTTPEAFFDMRPPTARLLAIENCQLSMVNCQLPTGRLLSLSAIFFDPGDWGEIASIYDGQLAEAALFDYIVAVKHKEVLSPNLPLLYGLPSVDGFDGGVLPLRAYSQLMRLILPDGATTTDGRLREYLPAPPEAKWLDLFNGRYLITDKTGDEWRALEPFEMSVFFDRQHPTDAPFALAHRPRFPATALALLSAGALGAVLLDDGRPADLLWHEGDLSLWALPPGAEQIAFAPKDGEWRILAATLADGVSGTFMPLALGNYRLIYSGDVKIYENLAALPRAFLLADWTWVADEAAALATMQEPDFDPRETAVLQGAPGDLTGLQNLSGLPGTAVILSYAPEQVIIRVEAAQPALLLLTDANYPGWRATFDGTDTPIYSANLLFRAIFVPAGTHEVVFWYEPESLRNGRTLSLLGLMLLLALAWAGRQPSHRP